MNPDQIPSSLVRMVLIRPNAATDFLSLPVHGAFGSGKSTMLVAIILALVKLLEQVDPDCTTRILYAPTKIPLCESP
jgi:hypothetical protein